MIILGVDPGTARIGYGVIEKTRDTRCVAYGCIEPKPKSQGERLLLLQQELERILKKYKPEILVVETLFFLKNLKTGMSVSEAKGVILLVAAKQNLPVFELTPLQVKMAVTGYGKAQKQQIQRMTKEILKLKELPKPDDAADALGLALAYSFFQKALAGK